VIRAITHYQWPLVEQAAQQIQIDSLQKDPEFSESQRFSRQKNSFPPFFCDKTKKM
jgi:hypothetical protein